VTPFSSSGPPGLGVAGVVVILLSGVLIWVSFLRPVLHTPEAPDPAIAPLPAIKIAINRATVAEVALLPGVGSVLAERIIADRDLHGPFASLEDVQRVPGIGPTIAERMAPLISFELPPTEPDFDRD